MEQMVIDRQTAAHYLWGENCDSWVLVDTTGLSIKQESMPGRTKEKPHFHTNAQQFFFILDGTATFYVADKTIVVTKEKGILIQPGTIHYIANEARFPLKFLVISQPTTNDDRTTVDR